MTQDNTSLALSELRILPNNRLPTGEPLQEIHASEEAYSKPALPAAVACPESDGEEVGLSDIDWATKPEDSERLWHARHNAYSAAKSLCKGREALVTECGVPISVLVDGIARTKELGDASELIAPNIGHMGTGNYHLLIQVDMNRTDKMPCTKHLVPEVNRAALSIAGPVTGKPGVRTGKKSNIAGEHAEAYLLLAQLEPSIDPLNIMTPGKLRMVN